MGSTLNLQDVLALFEGDLADALLFKDPGIAGFDDFGWHGLLVYSDEIFSLVVPFCCAIGNFDLIATRFWHINGPRRDVVGAAPFGQKYVAERIFFLRALFEAGFDFARFNAESECSFFVGTDHKGVNDRGAIQAQCHYAGTFVRSVFGDGDKDIVAVAAPGEGGLLGVRQQVCGVDEILKAWDAKLSVLRPCKDVQVEVGIFLCSTAKERHAGKWAGFGVVDCFAINLEPFAHRFQTCDKFLLDGAVWFGADVEKQVAALADYFDEHADEIAIRFEVCLIFVIAPGIHIDRDAAFPQCAIETGCWNELLRGAKVGFVAGFAFVDTVVDKRVGLVAADKGIDFSVAFEIGQGVFPFAIEPDHSNVAVASEELSELLFHEVDILVVVAAGFGVFIFPGTAGTIGGVVPIHDRVIEAEAETVFGSGLGKVFEGVAFVRRDFDIVVADFRSVDGKAIVMFGGDDDVFGTGTFKEAGPFFGVKVYGVELFSEDVVFRLWDLEEVAGPFVATDYGVGTPMDEDPKFGVFEPLQAGLIIEWWLGRLSEQGCRKEGDRNCELKHRACRLFY